MARRVFLHIGLPKTGTTYLQTIMWHNRAQMRQDGILLPGDERRDHLWSSLVVREDPKVYRRNPKARSSWDRIVGQIAEWADDAVISHEYFAGASEEQARDAIEALAPAEVHIVVTGRDPLGLFTASWQELVKLRGTTPIEKYSRTSSSNPLRIWNWRALDTGEVLERWAVHVPNERVHVLPLTPESPRELLWQRFAGVIGAEADNYDLTSSHPNESMGVVETEMLRRVNAHLSDFSKAYDVGVWIRSYLGEGQLVTRKGEKFWPDADQVEICRQRGRDMVSLIREREYDVVGDVDDLLVPDDLPERRHPGSVTDAEVAGAAVETVASMLRDVRRLTYDLRAAQRKLARARRKCPVAVPEKARSRMRRIVLDSPVLTRVYRKMRRV